MHMNMIQKPRIWHTNRRSTAIKDACVTPLLRQTIALVPPQMSIPTSAHLWVGDYKCRLNARVLAAKTVQHTPELFVIEILTPTHLSKDMGRSQHGNNLQHRCLCVGNIRMLVGAQPGGTTVFGSTCG